MRAVMSLSLLQKDAEMQAIVERAATAAAGGVVVVSREQSHQLCIAQRHRQCAMMAAAGAGRRLAY